MKRLMVMIGAVATALGLYAAAPETTELVPCGLGFEAGEPGVPTALPGSLDLSALQEQKKLWLGSSEVATVTPYEAGKAPAHTPLFEDTEQYNYLNIETDGAPLIRTLADASKIGTQAQGQQTNYVDLAEGSVYVDMLVKLSPFEEAPALADGSKIALWVKATENDDTTITTNLMLTCGYLGLDGEPAATNIVLDTPAFTNDIADTWHRLTILTKMDTKPGYGVTYFLVYIDGNLMAASNYDVFETGAAAAVLSDSAQKYVNAKQLFPSMVKFGSDFSGVLSMVQFEGSGQVDDLWIDAGSPYSIDMAIIDPANANVTKVVVDDEEVEGIEGVYTVPAGSEVAITLTAKAGYLFAGNAKTKTLKVEACDEYTIPASEDATKAGFAIILAETSYYLTLDSAVTAVADKGTITVVDDMTITNRFEVYGGDKAFTIDLNEKTITRKAELDSNNTYSGNGSAFDIKSGTITIKNGTIDCLALTQTVAQSTTCPSGSTTPFCECDAITVRNGANLTLEDMTVLVDNITGCCAYPFKGGTLAITSGTYENRTTEAYPFAPAGKSITAMVVNQHNATPQSLVISGGKFKGQNPATGDDSGAVVSFLADGYASKKIDEYWVVSKAGFAIIIAGEPTAYYQTLDDAIAAIEETGTITVVDDMSLEARLDVAAAGKTITIDLNGKTITRPDGSYSGNGSAFNVQSGTVTIKNGTIDLANLTQTGEENPPQQNECDAITVRNGAVVTLEGLNVTINSRTGSCAYAFDGGKITIKSGTYYNVTSDKYPFASGFDAMALNQANETTQAIFVEGGQFKATDPDAGDDSEKVTTFLAAGRASEWNDTGKYWYVGSAVASISDKAYLSLASANAAAKDGDTITLLANVSLASRIEITKAITIDLAGYTVTRTAGTDANTYSGNGSAFDLRANAGKVTIKGGTIDCLALTQTSAEANMMIGSTPKNECDAITVRSGANLTLDDMTILVNNITGCCVYPFAGGTVAITSGTYENRTTEAYPFAPAGKSITAMVVNQHNALPKSIEISGGKFKGQNPAAGDDSGAVKTFLAQGKATALVDGYWTVVGAVAEIAGKGYATLDAALEAAVAGDTVKLVDNITTEVKQQWNLTKNITLDFADKKITKTVANDWVFTIADGAEVVFTGTTGGIVHKPAAINQGYPASMIQIIGKLTVNGGVYESDFTIFKTDDVGSESSELVINDGTFTITDEPKYTGPTYAVMNWCKATIKGGTFNGNVVARSYQSQVYPSEITIDGGTFNAAVSFNQYGANDTKVGSIKVKDGLAVVPAISKSVAGNVVSSTTVEGYKVYSLELGAAMIGSTGYATLDAALDAAVAGNTVKLLKDIETAVAQQWTISKNITLDFNGKTITKKVTNDWVFTIAKDADVIFTGTAGGITFNPIALGNPNNPASMIQIFGKLTVNGGAYASDFTIFKVDEDGGCHAKGDLVVNGGTFTINAKPAGYTGPQWAVMNWSTATIAGGTWSAGAVIGTRSCDRNTDSQFGATTVDTSKVSGTPTYLLSVGYPGDTKFENMPMIKGVEKSVIALEQTASCTLDLEVVEAADGWYTVAEKAKIAKIGDKEYSTLKAAVDAAVDNDKIELLADYTLADDEQISFTKKVTFDLGDNDLTIRGDKTAFVIQAGADVVLTNGVITWPMSAYGIQVKGTVTVDDCDITNPAGKSGPVFDMYGTTSKAIVNSGTFEASGDIFRLTKDENASPTVIVNGGTFNGATEYGVFYVYKTNCVATITLNGGTFSQGRTLKFGASSPITVAQVQESFQWAGALLTDACKTKFKEVDSISSYIASGYAPVKGSDNYYTIQKAYDITITEPTNGTLETSVTNNIVAGTTVTVKATAASGYKLVSITTNGTALVGTTFEMPAEDVTVAATFEEDAKPVNPEQPSEPYDTKKEAEDAAKKINDNKETMINTPTGATPAQYTALFTAVVTADNKVVVELNETGTNTLQTSANALVKTVEALGTSATEVTITPAVKDIVPGFYYGLGASTTVAGDKVVGAGQWKKATTAGLEALSATKPAGNAGFFQVQVSVKEPNN